MSGGFKTAPRANRIAKEYSIYPIAVAGRKRKKIKADTPIKGGRIRL